MSSLFLRKTELFRVDPGSRDDMTVFILDQSHIQEKFPVIRVFKDHLSFEERFFIKTLDDLTDQFYMRFVGKEHISETGDGVDNSLDAEFFCGNGAINIAFDGEMMDQIRFFRFVNDFDAADRRFFPDRVGPLAGEIQDDMAET